MNDTMIVLLLPLLLLVMITRAVVHATNESSYKQGFTTGVDDYTECQDRPDDCSPPHNDTPLRVCVNNSVTNSTACIDGYIQGWQHWCKSDLKECGQFTMEGRLPGVLISGHNIYHTADGNNYLRLGPKHPVSYSIIPKYPNQSSFPQSTPKGVCPVGLYLDKTNGIYHCKNPNDARQINPNVKTQPQWQNAW